MELSKNLFALPIGMIEEEGVDTAAEKMKGKEKGTKARYKRDFPMGTKGTRFIGGPRVQKEKEEEKKKIRKKKNPGTGNYSQAQKIDRTGKPGERKENS